MKVGLLCNRNKATAERKILHTAKSRMFIRHQKNAFFSLFLYLFVVSYFSVRQNGMQVFEVGYGK